MSLFPHLTTVFLDTIIARLVPWFLTAAGGNLDLARQTAKALLASFDAETEEEVRLAAEIASYGFGALEALGKSVDPDLPLNMVLRLRGSANAMQRSKNQCQRSLDKLRKERRLAQAAVTDVRPEAIDRPAAIERHVQAAIAAPVPSVGADPAQPEPVITLSRQQRRAVQRAVDKAQRRQAELARRDAARAARATPAAALLIGAAPREAHPLPLP